MVTIVSHHIISGDKGRYVTTCLFRQVIINFPVIRFAIGTADCLVDSTGATVISSNHKIPVSIDIVHFFEITCGSPSCFNRVASFIYQAVWFQAIDLTCTNHKLPQTGSACAWHGRGVQCRFDNREISKFQWKSVCIQCFFKNRHIEVAGTQHERNLIAQASCIHIDEFADNIIIRHFHDGRDAWQAVDIDRVTE